MPIASQSLSNYTAIPFTATDGTTYKASLDAINSISSNTSGSLFVYPNTPVGLSVLVDDGFNMPQTGQTSPVMLNGASSPNVVTVVAPGSNSYYGCVYWDRLTSSAGIIYGAAAASPVPILPLAIWQVPLAFVLLTTGQTTVVASNIFDVRTWQTGVLPKAFGTVGTNQVLNCNNASTVFINLTISASIVLSLTNLRAGSNVGVLITSSGTFTFFMNAFQTNGVIYSNIIGVSTSNGTFVNLSTTGIPVTTSAAATIVTTYHNLGVLEASVAY